MIQRIIMVALLSLTLTGSDFSMAEDSPSGLSYDTGAPCLEADGTSAVKWLRIAAEQADLYGQFSLANCYNLGEGVRQDMVEAVRWQLIAANKGYAKAEYNLGIYYFKGEGVNKNLEEAKSWFEKAAKRKHEKAINVLKKNFQ